MTDNEPKVCLVTGATRGIGKAIASKMGAAGYTVVGTGRPAKRVHQPFRRICPNPV